MERENLLKNMEQFLGQNREKTIELSGISKERFDEILNGQEPTAKEIFGLAKATQSNFNYLVKLFAFESGAEVYTEDKIKKFIEANELSKLVDLYVSGLFIKIDGNLCITKTINNAVKLSNETATQIVEYFYDNGMVAIATQLSTENSFYNARKIMYAIKHPTPKAYKYLFGADNLKSNNFGTSKWFNAFFKACDEVEKGLLVDIIIERINMVKQIVLSTDKSSVIVGEGYFSVVEDKNVLTYLLPKYNQLEGLSVEQKNALDNASSWIKEFN